MFSLRAIYGTSIIKNGFHGSNNAENAMSEIQAFFPSYLQKGFLSRGSIINKSGSIIQNLASSIRNSLHNLSVSKLQLSPPQVIQRTLALIKPDAFPSKKDDIMYIIKNSGFTIVSEKEILMSNTMVKEFYKEHEGKSFHDDLVAFMTRFAVIITLKL